MRVTLKSGHNPPRDVVLARGTTVAALKVQIAAEHPTLPPPRLQKLICHGVVLQDEQLMCEVAGTEAALTVLLIPIRPAPSLMERYTFSASEAWENGRLLAGHVWGQMRRGAWREALACLGRNLVLFFRTLFVPPTSPAGAHGRQGRAGLGPP